MSRRNWIWVGVVVAVALAALVYAILTPQEFSGMPLQVPAFSNRAI